jgi:hypothetical protein
MPSGRLRHSRHHHDVVLRQHGIVLVLEPSREVHRPAIRTRMLDPSIFASPVSGSASASRSRERDGTLTHSRAHRRARHVVFGLVVLFLRPRQELTPVIVQVQPPPPDLPALPSWARREFVDDMAERSRQCMSGPSAPLFLFNNSQLTSAQTPLALQPPSSRIARWRPSRL